MSLRLDYPLVNGQRSTWPRLEGLPLPAVAPFHEQDGLALLIAMDSTGNPAAVATAEPEGLRLELVPPAGRRWALVDERTDPMVCGVPGADLTSVRPLIPWKSVEVALALRPDPEGR